MSTSVSGVSSHFPDAENGFTTTTSGSVAIGATTVGLNSTAGYSNGEPVVMVIDPSNTKKQTFTGIVDTGGNQVTGVVWTAGTNVAHDAGATVVDYATATHIAMISKGIKVEHSQDGTHKPALLTSRSEDTTPADGDYVLTADVSDSNNLKKVTRTNFFNDPPLGQGSVDGDDLSTSAVFLGYAEATSDQGSITSVVDLTSLSVSVTVPAGGRRVKVTGYVCSGNNTVDQLNSVYIFESTTQLSADSGLSRSGGRSYTHQVMWIGTPSAGSHTYKLRADAGGGTMTTKASATAPAFILVELI
jgi:hypothetical protein